MMYFADRLYPTPFINNAGIGAVLSVVIIKGKQSKGGVNLCACVRPNVS